MYNKLMNKCNCNESAAYSCVPAPNPCRVAIRTQVIPATLGDDTAGAPYAPLAGKWYNTVVSYQANGANYIFDSNGVYTKITPANYDKLVAQVAGLEEALTALQAKEQADVENLQANINQIFNKEAMDVEALQTNINAEVNAREAADTALSNRVEEIHNSPDVVDIVDTYAALEAYNTSTLHDNDIVRVLRDETHNGESYYYRWNATEKTWAPVGSVGDYYTKQEIDSMIGDVETTLNNLDSGEGV